MLHQQVPSKSSLSTWQPLLSGEHDFCTNAVQIIGSISYKSWPEMRYHSCIHNTAPAKRLQMLQEVEQGGEMRTERKSGKWYRKETGSVCEGEWKFKGSGASRLEGINLSLALLTLRLLVHMLCWTVICCPRVLVLQSVWSHFVQFSSRADSGTPEDAFEVSITRFTN